MTSRRRIPRRPRRPGAATLGARHQDPGRTGRHRHRRRRALPRPGCARSHHARRDAVVRPLAAHQPAPPHRTLAGPIRGREHPGGAGGHRRTGHADRQPGGRAGRGCAALRRSHRAEDRGRPGLRDLASRVPADAFGAPDEPAAPPAASTAAQPAPRPLSPRTQPITAAKPTPQEPVLVELARPQTSAFTVARTISSRCSRRSRPPSSC